MKDTKPQVYIHDCFIINQVGKHEREGKKPFKLMKNMTITGQKVAHNSIKHVRMDDGN